MKLSLLICFILLSPFIKAQKKPLYSNEEAVIEAAYLHLEESEKNGELKEWAINNTPKGSYTMELTLRNKGEVATIRAIERKNGDIPTQNALKNFMKAYRFPFKIPKEKSFKFKYEFNF